MKTSPGLKIINAETGEKIEGSEIWGNVEKFIEVFKNYRVFPNDVVFIDIPRCSDTIFAILSCLQLKIAFTFCQENGISLSNSKFRTTLVFDGQKIRRIGENERKEKINDICYVISTSGTTGIRKQVAVPIDCIQPNIDHFCTLFEVTSSDSILFSTSLLFDPSIVELFMAFQAGCTIILTPDEFRREPFRMGEVIEKYQPTIGQFTPTVLEMLPSSILSPTSSFRILLLGGSHFPLELIRSLRSPESATRIFNVYGVTEVSCWASAFEVETDCEVVLLGDEIRGSLFEVSEEMELIIGGPRQCYVNGEMHEKHRTGDRVEQAKGGGLTIVGRMNRVVKHRGFRVCLDHLSSLVLNESPSLQSVHFIHHNNRHLVMFTSGHSTSQTPTSTSIRIDDNTVVTATVIHVSQMPINSSGKVDEKELAKLLDEWNWDFRSVVEKKLKVELTGQNLEKSFVELGVKSLLAAELSAMFAAHEVEALRMILDPKITIREFLNKFEHFEKKEMSSENETTLETIEVIKRRQPPMKWAVDLRKCIDGNVLVVNTSLVVCASHSGIVVAVNPSTGHVIWRTDCEVRFEATPTLVGDQVVIGNKTHGLYFISLETGELSTRIETIGVRARVSFDGNFIYCTTESGVFHAIDPTTRLSIFHHQVARGGTSIGPIISPDGSIYVTTTAGHVARITVDQGNFEVHWNRNFGPMFAEPTFFFFFFFYLFILVKKSSGEK